MFLPDDAVRVAALSDYVGRRVASASLFSGGTTVWHTIKKLCPYTF